MWNAFKCFKELLPLLTVSKSWELDPEPSDLESSIKTTDSEWFHRICRDIYQANFFIYRLRKQADFDKLDQDMLIEILSDKCEKFEASMDTLREVRMVLERKKPTTFPG